MTAFDAKAFGRRLKETRLARAMTQEDLGYQSKISSRQISAYERGCEVAGVNKLYVLCSVLCTSADYLLGFEDKTEGEGNHG